MRRLLAQVTVVQIVTWGQLYKHINYSVHNSYRDTNTRWYAGCRQNRSHYGFIYAHTTRKHRNKPRKTSNSVGQYHRARVHIVPKCDIDHIDGHNLSKVAKKRVNERHSKSPRIGP